MSAHDVDDDGAMKMTFIMDDVGAFGEVDNQYL